MNHIPIIEGGIRMKHLINKKNTVVISLMLIIAVAFGAVFIAVKADKVDSKNYTFPGIESQLDALSNMPAIGDNVYNILEILPNNESGGIGYLVEGQEPRPLQNEMEAHLKKNGIGRTTISRTSYMNTTLPLNLASDGLVLIEGDLISEPITKVGPYIEYPFPTMVPTTKTYKSLKLEAQENWNIKGEYLENDRGEGNYDTNIVGFSYDESTGTYGVNFNEITFSNIKSQEDDYQIYDKIYKTNVGSVGEIYYTEVGSAEYLNKAKTIESNEQGTFVASMEERIVASYPDEIARTLKNQPYKKSLDENGKVTFQLLSQGEFIPTNTYWYINMVKKIVVGEEILANQTVCQASFSDTYFQVSDYKYYNESEYANYNAIIDSENPYRVANGNGYYDFKPDDTKSIQKVTIGQVYYTGGYENNNWFKEKLMVSLIGDSLPIKVTSLTESQFAQQSAAEQEDLIAKTDYIKISGSKNDTNFYENINNSNPNTLTVEEAQLLVNKINSGVACQIEGDVIGNISKLRQNGISLSSLSYLYRVAILSITKDIPLDVAPTEQEWNNLTNELNADGRAVYQNRYIGGKNKESYYPEFEEAVPNEEFQEVTDYIELENLSRGEQEKLCSDSNGEITLYSKNLIQYIMNYRGRKELTLKTKIKVLDLEPANGTAYERTYLNSVDDAKVSSDVLTEFDVQTMLMNASDRVMNIDAKNIEIVHMSTAEFIGHNEDLNATYDLIYIGAGYDDDVMNRDGSGFTKYNDTNMQGLIYAHTGDYVYAWALTGQLDSSYADLKYEKAYGSRFNNKSYLPNVGVDSDKYKFATDWKQNVYSGTTYKLGNLGIVRYSDNDITKIKMKELQEYVKGNNPVIVSDKLIKNRQVIENAVDNSSYLYEFLFQGKDNPNVIAREVAPTDSLLINYINITKPVIEFLDNYNRPIVDTTVIGDSNLYSSAYEYGEQIASLNNGKFRTTFRINNGELDRTKQSQYVLKFFVDMNADGKYIKTDDASELLQDIILKTDGKTAYRNADGNYIIWSGKNYVLERSMSASYVGIFPWKLEIEQMSNNRSRVSQIAYTKAQTAISTKKEIRVLQVTPSNGKTNTMNLKDQTIKDMLALTDYQINVQQVDARNLATTLNMRGYNGQGDMDGFAYYDMLVIGFADSYLDAGSTATKQAIIKFIQTGKSVLMSHDFVSYMNMDRSVTTTIIGGDGYSVSTADKHLDDDFRDLMGLDRYGVTTQDKVDSSMTQSQFLRQGELINYNSTDEKWYTEWQTSTITKDPEHKMPAKVDKAFISSQKLLSDRDIAYAPKTNRMQAYAEVEGYSNGQINRSKNSNASASLRNNRVTGTNMLTNQANKINDGVITHYPYEIGQTIKTVDTHGQYYQLDMDSDKDKDGSPDIVVWYTISPGTKTDSNTNGTKGDVRNNYYIYSIGNIMYTGFGHSKYSASTDSGQELKLFINTFVAAYKLQLQEFEITPLESANASAADLDNHLLNSDGVNRLDNSIHFDFLVQDPNLVSNNKTVTTTYSLQDANDNDISIPSGLTFTTINSETGKTLLSGSNSSNGSVLEGMESGRIYTVTLNNISGITGDFKVKTSIETRYNYYGNVVTTKAERDVSFRTAVLFNLN